MLEVLDTTEVVRLGLDAGAGIVQKAMPVLAGLCKLYEHCYGRQSPWQVRVHESNYT